MYIFDIVMAEYEDEAEAVAVMLHEALCVSNAHEFGDTGYDGMTDLVDDGVDHYLWGDWPVDYCGAVIHHLVTRGAPCGQQVAIYQLCNYNKGVIHPTVMPEHPARLTAYHYVINEDEDNVIDMADYAARRTIMPGHGGDNHDAA